MPSSRSLDLHQNLIGHLHRHAAKVGYKVNTVGVTGETTFITLFSLLSAKREDITAVTAPVGSHVGEVFKTMRNAVVKLGLVGVRLGVGLGDALGDDFGVALFVTSVVAVGALHSGSILEKFATEGAAHNVVELLLDELVSILLNHILFALTDGALATKTKVKGLFVARVLDKRHGEMDTADRLQ